MAAVNRSERTIIDDVRPTKASAPTAALHSIAGSRDRASPEGDRAATTTPAKRIRAADALALCLLDSAGGV